MSNITLIVKEYLDVISSTRSPRTHNTYMQGLRAFVDIVGDHADLNTDTYILFLRKTKNMHPATQATYRVAVMGLYLFGSKDKDAEVNFSALKQATRQYGQRRGVRLPNFDREALETVIDYCAGLSGDLLDYRDRAFVLTLADTGLRTSEACGLHRGDIDWNEARTIIIGKGDKQAVVRFSNRSIKALQDYLSARAKLDGDSGKPAGSLPLFARHDKGAGKKVKPVSSSGMWAAIKQRAMQAGIDPSKIRIHDFRHYFVTIAYLASGDIKLTQNLARHADISTTGRYTHLDQKIDMKYNEIFNKEKEGQSDNIND